MRGTPTISGFHEGSSCPRIVGGCASTRQRGLAPDNESKTPRLVSATSARILHPASCRIGRVPHGHRRQGLHQSFRRFCPRLRLRCRDGVHRLCMNSRRGTPSISVRETAEGSVTEAVQTHSGKARLPELRPMLAARCSPCCAGSSACLRRRPGPAREPLLCHCSP